MKHRFVGFQTEKIEEIKQFQVCILKLSIRLMAQESELEKSLISKNHTQINQLSLSLTLIDPTQFKKEKEEPGFLLRGKWSWEEELLYYRFVKVNKERLMKTTFTKKYCKFSKMAQFINSKTVTQCRSHYQKTLNKYSTLDAFLQHFESRHFPRKQQPPSKQVGIQVQLPNSDQRPELNLEKREKAADLSFSDSYNS